MNMKTKNGDFMCLPTDLFIVMRLVVASWKSQTASTSPKRHPVALGSGV